VINLVYLLSYNKVRLVTGLGVVGRAVIVMKIIVVTQKNSEKKTHIMIELLDKGAIKELKKHINNMKWRKAVRSVIEKGRFIKELTEKDVTEAASDLILTAQNAYWNLL